MKSISNLLLLWLVITSFVFAAIHDINTSKNSDEADHMAYGISIWKGEPERYIADGDQRSSTMPVTAFNAFPRAVQQLFNKELKKTDGGRQDIYRGRMVSLVVSLFLLLFIFRFAQKLGGSRAGIAAVALLALHPIAIYFHKRTSLDVYATFSFLVTLYFLYRWLESNKKPFFYLWVLAFSISLVCKANNILLIVPMAIIIALKWKNISWSFWKTIRRSVMAILVALSVINLAYLYHGFGTPLKNYPFKSEQFQKLKTGGLAGMPLPLATPFLASYDLITYDLETLDGEPPNYLYGKEQMGEPFYELYVVHYLFKTPVIALLVILFGFLAVLRDKKDRKIFLLYNVIPSAFFIIYYSIQSIQPGYRYLLPIVALNIIFSSAFLFKHGKVSHRWLVIIVFFALLTMLSALPEFRTFTNVLDWSDHLELVKPRTN